MKLYRVTWQHPHEGTCFLWCGSASIAEAEAHRVEIENADSALKASIRIIEIPTDKSGLMDWLNRNFTRDNG